LASVQKKPSGGRLRGRRFDERLLIEEIDAALSAEISTDLFKAYLQKLAARAPPRHPLVPAHPQAAGMRPLLQTCRLCCQMT
jgi:hypothetical protein